jgi:hypothetical protein
VLADDEVDGLTVELRLAVGFFGKMLGELMIWFGVGAKKIVSGTRSVSGPTSHSSGTVISNALSTGGLSRMICLYILWE